MTGPLRILVVGAHPADIFDQSGGTMAYHVSRGDFVACVVLTHGARIHDDVISEAMWHEKEFPGADELLKLMSLLPTRHGRRADAGAHVRSRRHQAPVVPH